MRESGSILAVVTLRPESVGGATPSFFARDEAERERLATYLSRILDAMVHDLENGTYILVRH
ncbi:MAG TPA: hypothetical protein DEQ28_09045 [Clostridiales bacterium]|nr:hypothetical protein [Clostridiales bacterium]